MSKDEITTEATEKEGDEKQVSPLLQPTNNHISQPSIYPPVRALAESALLAVIAALLGVASLFLPLVGLLLSLVWPLPLMLATLRHGLRYGVMATVVAAILLILFTGPIQGLLLVVNMAGVGLVFGFCFRKHLSAGRTLFAGILAAAVSAALTVVLSSIFGDISFAAFLQEANGAVDQVLEMYRQAGMLETMEQAMGLSASEIRQTMIHLVQMVLPAAFIMMAMVCAIVNYALSKVVLKRLGYATYFLLPFRLWRMPWQMIWGVIAGLGAFALNHWLEQPLLQTIAWNMLYIMGPILAVFGLSFVVWLWKRFPSGFSHLLWILLLIFFFQYVPILLMLLGLINSVVDLRRLYGEPDAIGKK